MFIQTIPDFLSHLDRIQESIMTSKTPWRTQRKIGLLNDYIWTSYRILIQVVALVANCRIIAIYQSFQVGFLDCKRESLTLLNLVITVEAYLSLF